MAFTTYEWSVINRLYKVPVVNENQTRLLFQVISVISCVTVKRIPWASLSTFTSLRMNSSPTLFWPNRLYLCSYFISSPNITVRHEVSARPGRPLQLRRSRDLQVCGLHHWLAPWEESNCQTGAWTKDISYFVNFGAWWIVVKGLTAWVQLLQWDSLVINRKIYLNYLNLTTKWHLSIPCHHCPTKCFRNSNS